MKDEEYDNRRGVGDGQLGNCSNDDLAGTRHGGSLGEGESGVDEEVGERARTSIGQQAQDGKIVRSHRSQELIQAADVLRVATESELEDAGLVQFSGSTYSYDWYGMVPSPDEFNKYDVATRERICKWNDAFTSDESARQDRLVDNEIEQQKVGIILTFILIVLFGVATFASFIITRHPASFGFLSVPVLNILRPNVKSKSSRDDATKDRLPKGSRDDATKDSDEKS